MAADSVETDRRSWLGLATGVFGLRAIGPALRFAVQLGLARWLPVGAFGQYALASASADLAGNAALVGQQFVALRYIPVHREAGEHRRRAALLRHAWARVTTLALAAGIFLALPPVADRLVGDDTVARAALVLMPLVAAGLILHEATLTGDGRPASAAGLLEILRPTVLLGALAVLAVTIEPDLGIYLLATTLTLATAVVVLLGWMLHRAGPGTRRDVPADERAQWRITARFGYLAALSLVVFYQSDIVVVGLVLSPAETAVFAVATKLADLAKLPLRAVQAVVVPGISVDLAAGDRPAARAGAAQAQRASLVAGGLVVLGLAIAGPFVLDLFGDGYRDGYATLVILLAGTLANAATGPYPDIVWLSGRSRAHGLVLSAHAAANIIGSVVGAHLAGIEGVAVATALTNISWNVVLARMARRAL